MTFLADSYTGYRANFGLHWLSVLLAETLGLLIEAGLLDDAISANGPVDEVVAPLLAIRAYGPIPIALASEFNIR